MAVLIMQGDIVTSPVSDFSVTDDLQVADKIDAGGDLTVLGKADITGKLTTVANAEIGTTLAVVGAATVGGALGVTGALTAAGGIVLGAGDDLTVDGAGAGVKFGQTGSKIGLFGVTPVAQPTALTVALTTVTCSAPGTPDYAIAAPVQNTGFGFSTADEMLSVLKALANAQARIAELETKLVALGAVHA